jgi:hypothetical protein
MYKTTFKDFMEQLYKKPYNQIPKKRTKRTRQRNFWLWYF